MIKWEISRYDKMGFKSVEMYDKMGNIQV